MKRLTKFKKSLRFPRLILKKKVTGASMRLSKKVDRYVTKKPYRTLGIIMLASAFAGYIAHR